MGFDREGLGAGGGFGGGFEALFLGLQIGAEFRQGGGALVSLRRVILECVCGESKRGAGGIDVADLCHHFLELGDLLLERFALGAFGGFGGVLEFGVLLVANGGGE